jgi:ubiquinone/menaquinone biosynthesis C-methylase UbiE
MESPLDDAVSLIKESASNPDIYTHQQIAQAVDLIVAYTRLMYEQEAVSYENLRGTEISSDDLRMNQMLLEAVRRRVSLGLIRLPAAARWRLLDVGAGYGRDTRFFSIEPDITVSALDNCLPLLDTLRKRKESGEIVIDQIIDADMRDISMIASNSFECVRNYATLHHVPLASYGLGADSVISETRRVLVHGGIFQCLVKKGSGVAMTDTGEGLGRRFYQFFNEHSLSQLLERHGLEPLECATFLEPRPSGNVEWIMMLSYAR